MGTKIKDILERKEVEYSELKGKPLVVDSFNVMYQFLATIRMQDGSLLTDSKGNVTSHLSGLFARTANLMQKGLKLAFVFDGEAPKLKKEERKKRREAKEKATKEYEAAKQREDIEEMKKFASRTSVLTREMVEEAKKLVDAMGCPVIQAPSEGEAQAAFMVTQGDAWAEVSQDFDALMFGVPRLVRNLTVSEKRKLPSKLAYQIVKPELYELKNNLKALGITQDQLIAVCMLVGTDFNPEGIKGVGPKGALKLVKKHKNMEEVFAEAKWDEHFDIAWEDVFDTIKHIPTTSKYELRWKMPDEGKIKKLLCGEHDFSEERVESTLEKLDKEREKQSQKGLGEFT